MTRKPGPVALALFMALVSPPAGAENQGTGSASEVNDLDRIGNDGAAVPAASGDCPMKGIAVDPDGVLRRTMVSRSTHLLAASHPLAQ